MSWNLTNYDLVLEELLYMRYDEPKVFKKPIYDKTDQLMSAGQFRNLCYRAGRECDYRVKVEVFEQPGHWVTITKLLPKPRGGVGEYLPEDTLDEALAERDARWKAAAEGFPRGD